jgi:uncharacterized DUF497 family protein
MRFTWDPAKSYENLRRRNIDFEFASRVFAGFTLEWPDIRREYGEKRMVAVGVAAGRELTVVYTDRQNVSGEIERRIISARQSNKRERNAYARSASN